MIGEESMERILEILKVLNKAKGYVKAEELAHDFNVTTRTIRNDLTLLEEFLQGQEIELIKKRNLGIVLSKKNIPDKEFSELTEKILEEKDFYSSDERERMIMECLLLSKKAITINELEEMTLSSKSSLTRNLTTCEKKLEKWQIKLHKKPRVGIVVTYKEYNWRMAVLAHILQNTGKKDFQLLYDSLLHSDITTNKAFQNKFVEKVVGKSNILYISNFIRRYEMNNNMKYTDKAFISILLYICIAQTRIRNGYCLEQNTSSLNKFFETSHIDRLLDNNIAFLNKGLEERFNRFELEAVLVYMLSQKYYSETGTSENELLLEDKRFHKKSCRIVREFIQSAQYYLNVDLISDETLFENLLLHIKPTIFRLLFGIKLENPLKDYIKTSYPEIFSACERASKVITEGTDSIIDEHEISYLALHVGASIEKAKEKQIVDYYRVLIVCPEGVGTSSILHYRLLNNFPNIQIEQICSLGELNLINKEDIDLIVSTVPLNEQQHKFNVIDVNPLLEEKDIIKIKRAMKRIGLVKDNSSSLVVEDLMSIISNYAIIKDYEELRSKISHYFDQSSVKKVKNQPSLVSFTKQSVVALNVEVENWEQAFQVAGELLAEDGCVTPSYIECMILAAKKYGAYMMIGNGVALPHAKPSDGALKTGFSFVTLKNPVWFEIDGESHRIDFVVGLAADNSLSHLTAMGELIDLIYKKEFVNLLLKMTDKKEFVRTIKEIIKNSQDKLT